MLNEARQQTINQAMTEAGGDQPRAASILGIVETSLRDALLQDPVLRARWVDKPKLPPATSIINRPEDLAVAEAMAREEKAVAAGMKDMKVSPRAANLAVACFNYYRKNAASILNLTGGGIAMQFAETLARIEEIDASLNGLDPANDRYVAMQSILRDDRSRLLDWLHKAACKVDQGILIQAKVQRLLNEGEPQGKGKGKPGFGSLKRADVTPV